MFKAMLYATQATVCCLHPTHARDGPTVLAGFGAPGPVAPPHPGTPTALFSPAPAARKPRHGACVS